MERTGILSKEKSLGTKRTQSLATLRKSNYEPSFQPNKGLRHQETMRANFNNDKREASEGDNVSFFSSISSAYKPSYCSPSSKRAPVSRKELSQFKNQNGAGQPFLRSQDHDNQRQRNRPNEAEAEERWKSQSFKGEFPGNHQANRVTTEAKRITMESQGQVTGNASYRPAFFEVSMRPASPQNIQVIRQNHDKTRETVQEMLARIMGQEEPTAQETKKCIPQEPSRAIPTANGLEGAAGQIFQRTETQRHASPPSESYFLEVESRKEQFKSKMEVFSEKNQLKEAQFTKPSAIRQERMMGELKWTNEGAQMRQNERVDYGLINKALSSGNIQPLSYTRNSERDHQRKEEEDSGVAFGGNEKAKSKVNETPDFKKGGNSSWSSCSHEAKIEMEIEASSQEAGKVSPNQRAVSRQLGETERLSNAEIRTKEEAEAYLSRHLNKEELEKIQEESQLHKERLTFGSGEHEETPIKDKKNSPTVDGIKEETQRSPEREKGYSKLKEHEEEETIQHEKEAKEPTKTITKGKEVTFQDAQSPSRFFSDSSSPNEQKEEPGLPVRSQKAVTEPKAKAKAIFNEVDDREARMKRMQEIADKITSKIVSNVQLESKGAQIDRDLRERHFSNSKINDESVGSRVHSILTRNFNEKAEEAKEEKSLFPRSSKTAHLILLLIPWQ